MRLSSRAQQQIKQQRKLEHHFLYATAQYRSRSIMYIPCTSFSFASILRTQSLRHSKFCTLLEVGGGQRRHKENIWGHDPTGPPYTCHWANKQYAALRFTFVGVLSRRPFRGPNDFTPFFRKKECSYLHINVSILYFCVSIHVNFLHKFPKT